MAEIKLTVSRLNPTERVNLATKLKDLLAPEAPETPPIPNMTDPVAALVAKLIPAKTANDAYEKMKADLAALKTVRDDAAAALGDQLNQIAADAQSASKGKAEQLQKGGFDIVSATPGPAPAVGQAQNLTLSAGKVPATVAAKCTPDSQAVNYEWQVSTGDAMNGPYTTSAHSSSAKATLKNLASGQRIWARVRAIGRGDTGEGPWSDPATIIVP